MFGACSLPLLNPQKTGREEEPKIDEEQRGAGLGPGRREEKHSFTSFQSLFLFMVDNTYPRLLQRLCAMHIRCKLTCLSAPGK